MVGLDMDTVVVGEHRVVVARPVLDIVSCWDPCDMMYSVLLVVDSPLDELK